VTLPKGKHALQLHCNSTDMYVRSDARARASRAAARAATVPASTSAQTDTALGNCILLHENTQSQVCRRCRNGRSMVLTPSVTLDLYYRILRREL
jgi:hypothetical protein